jgi:hypothetical protein
MMDNSRNPIILTVICHQEKPLGLKIFYAARFVPMNHNKQYTFMNSKDICPQDIPVSLKAV